MVLAGVEAERKEEKREERERRIINENEKEKGQTSGGCGPARTEGKAANLKRQISR